jgi:hypothetical protein
VYLAVDNRYNDATGRPTWLTDPGYVDQGYDVVIRQSATSTFAYSVWRKSVTAGSVVSLPRISSSTAPCYLVIVQ